MFPVLEGFGSETFGFVKPYVLGAMKDLRKITQVPNPGPSKLFPFIS